MDFKFEHILFYRIPLSPILYNEVAVVSYSIEESGTLKYE